MAGPLALVRHRPAAPAISGDGRYVAYSSTGANLATGQVDGPQGTEVFLYDRLADVNTQASHVAGFPATAAGRDVSTSAGTPLLSTDGSRTVVFVVFTSEATWNERARRRAARPSAGRNRQTAVTSPSMLSEYIGGALRKARYEILADDGSFYVEIPGFDGVFANAPTEQGHAIHFQEEPTTRSGLRRRDREVLNRSRPVSIDPADAMSTGLRYPLDDAGLEPVPRR